MFGLGPSPRAINPRDTTVIEVHAEDGITTVKADVSFQASAFLGTVSQDSVVHAKLDHVFEQMRAQLGVERWLDSAHEEELLAYQEPPVAQSEVSIAESAPLHDTQSVLPEMQPEIGDVATPGPQTEEREAADASPVELTEAQEETAVIPEHAVEPEPPETIEPEPVSVARKSDSEPVIVELEQPAWKTGSESPVLEEKKLEPVVEEKMPELATVRGEAKPAVTTAKLQPSVITMDRERPSGQLETAASSQGDSNADRSDAKKSRRLRWSAWAAATVVLVLAPVAWLYLPRDPKEEVAPAQQTQPSAQAASVEPAPAHAVPVQQPAPAEPAPSPAAAKEPGSDEDPAAAVKDWESAMSSRDASAQAAFYADPVERYFLRHNVTKDQVVADKQAVIDRRKGIWTVKMERVQLTRPNDKAVKVSLVKHYRVQEDGKSVSEWFVPSQLQWIRADGRWQIKSERDLGWAPTMDELDY